MFNKRKGESLELSTENITTIIAEDCKIEGTIDCKAFIKVDGQALGGINSVGGVILGQKGIVRGDIKTKELIVYGKIEGDIYADNLTLKSTSSIIGNIQVKSFQVETGAIYRGLVSMDQVSAPIITTESTKHNNPSKENYQFKEKK
ncbi:MAG: polymer-forming cytoskeletal protein [Flavobacteriaceae bacterium]|jgi:cytoskeletal protein CcmA (bactofilin family)|nr:polymer-forming cytoskeletal protein [Flavobacteriaceae bacterium]